MGIQLENIHPISDFVRNYTTHADRIEKDSRVEILTRGGRPSLAVMPALAYEKLLEAQDFLETIESIDEGLAAAARGEVRPVEEFFNELKAL